MHLLLRFAPAEALEDAEVGLKLLPLNPDFLYVKAYSLMTIADQAQLQYQQGLGGPSGKGRGNSSSSSSTKRQCQFRINAAIQALQEFLDHVPAEHPKRPHGFYSMAAMLLTAGMAFKQDSVGGDTRLRRVQALLDAAAEAETQLPPFFLPVECGSKGLAIFLLQFQKATCNQASVPGRRSTRSSSSRGR